MTHTGQFGRLPPLSLTLASAKVLSAPRMETRRVKIIETNCRRLFTLFLISDCVFDRLKLNLNISWFQELTEVVDRHLTAYITEGHIHVELKLVRQNRRW